MTLALKALGSEISQSLNPLNTSILCQKGKKAYKITIVSIGIISAAAILYNSPTFVKALYPTALTVCCLGCATKGILMSLPNTRKLYFNEKTDLLNQRDDYLMKAAKIDKLIMDRG